MIRLACEIPLAYLNTLGKQMHYEFCLAHLAEQNDQYLAFYKEQVATGRLCILDNGVFELGHPIETARVMNIYEKLNINNARSIKNVVVVAPDAFGDGQKTVSNVQGFKEELGILKPRIMGVVQGQNFEEWVWCYTQLAQMPDINMIGVPYEIRFDVPGVTSGVLSHTKNQMFLRIALFEHLITLGKLCNKPHHLLGTSDPFELYYQSAIPQIETVDTSTPIAQALVNDMLKPQGFAIHEDKTKRPPNYFEIPYDVNIEKLCNYNIAATKMWARGRQIF